MLDVFVERICAADAQSLRRYPLAYLVVAGLKGALRRFILYPAQRLSRQRHGMWGEDMTWGNTWISKDDLDRIPELPGRVDFDDCAKDRGLVNLLSERKKNAKPWLPAGFYKKTKGGRLCVLEVRRSLKGGVQAGWESRKCASECKRI
jgi:hypothetical protein